MDRDTVCPYSLTSIRTEQHSDCNIGQWTWIHVGHITVATVWPRQNRVTQWPQHWTMYRDTCRPHHCPYSLTSIRTEQHSEINAGQWTGIHMGHITVPTVWPASEQSNWVTQWPQHWTLYMDTCRPHHCPYSLNSIRTRSSKPLHRDCNTGQWTWIHVGYIAAPTIETGYTPSQWRRQTDQ